MKMLDESQTGEVILHTTHKCLTSDPNMYSIEVMKRVMEDGLSTIYL